MSCFINRHAFFCEILLRSDEILTCLTARLSLINVFLNSYIILFLGICDLLIINSFVRFGDWNMSDSSSLPDICPLSTRRSESDDDIVWNQSFLISCNVHFKIVNLFES